jgi:hypothetical protein
LPVICQSPAHPRQTGRFRVDFIEEKETFPMAADTVSDRRTREDFNEKT